MQNRAHSTNNLYELNPDEDDDPNRVYFEQSKKKVSFFFVPSFTTSVLMPIAIRYIIDLDGFMINKKFYAKEMGVMDYQLRKLFLFRFQLNYPYSKLSEKDRKSAWYCKNFVHGLEFKDNPNDVPQSHLLPILRRYFDQCNRTKYYIAYKGGNIERDLLTQQLLIHLQIRKFRNPKIQRTYQTRSLYDRNQQIKTPNFMDTR